MALFGGGDGLAGRLVDGEVEGLQRGVVWLVAWLGGWLAGCMICQLKVLLPFWSVL